MNEFGRAKYVTYTVAVVSIVWGIFAVGSALQGTAVAILMFILYKLDLIERRIQHRIAVEKTVAKRLGELPGTAEETDLDGPSDVSRLSGDTHRGSVG